MEVELDWNKKVDRKSFDQQLFNKFFRNIEMMKHLQIQPTSLKSSVMVTMNSPGSRLHISLNFLSPES